LHYLSSDNVPMPYWVALQYAELPSLSDRRDKLYRDFFRKLLNPSNCIHQLLLLPRDTEISSRLRKATTYPRPLNRANCYKSFIYHALLFIKYYITVLGSLLFFHRIAFHFSPCLLSFCCTVHYCLFSFFDF